VNRVAWFRVIADLELRGVTLRSQAEAAGFSVGTIYYWKAGGEPRYASGERLIGLYTETIGIEPPRLTMPST